MKKIQLLLLYIVGINGYAQNTYNPYADFTGQTPLNYAGIRTGTNTGEYELFFKNFHHWQNFQLSLSYKIEVVSFPFIPDFQLSASNTRIFRVPPDLFYDPLMHTWDMGFDYPVSGKIFKEHTGGSITGVTFISQQSVLVSDAFEHIGATTGAWPNPGNIPSNVRTIYPHSVLKHTIYVHCGSNWQTAPVIDSLSFVIDHTRGKMREYPFTTTNYMPGAAVNHDVTVFPELFLSSDYFQTTDPLNIGTIDYFPVDEPNSSLCNGIFAPVPSQINPFYDPAQYIHPAPFSLSGFKLMDANGGEPAGYAKNNTGTALIPLSGLLHKYVINTPLDVTILNPSEKIIYNPSEAEIDIGNINTPLVFPSGYTFKTIQGRYPTEPEVQAAAFNKVYDDRRKVPVSSTLTLDDDLSTPIDERISYYYIKPGSKLVIDPCVTIHDAEIKLMGPGAILEYDPAHTYGNFTINNTAGGTVTQVSYPQPLPCAEECHFASTYDYLGEQLGTDEPVHWTVASLPNLGLTGPVVRMAVSYFVGQGSTLIIEEGLRFEFFEGAGIVVNPGGTLIVNGTAANPVIFTSACQKLWKGIDVQGIKTSFQSGAIQGKIRMNNAIIENAVTGVTTVKKDKYGNADLNFTGGIIKMQNCTIRNCRTGVQFLPYSPFISASSFYHCIFETTGQLIEPSVKPDAFVSLNNIRGVRFSGCTFRNTAPALFASGDRGKGINSMDANFAVYESSVQPCKFENLYYGIDASAPTTFYNIYVRKSRFTGNTNGILLSSVKNATIISNDFDIGFVNDVNPYGIYLNNAKGYIVEDNDFFSANIENAIGAIVNSTNQQVTQINEIYRNRYADVIKGIQHQSTTPSLTQLRIKCNDFTQNGIKKVDIAITSGNMGNQGSCGNSSSPAGNEFGPCVLSVNPFKHIWANPSVNSFTYNYHTGGTSFTPSCNSSQVVTNQCTDAFDPANSCPSKLVSPCPACPRQTVAQIDALNILLAAGDAPSLYQIIASNSSLGQIKNALLTPGPYLSDGVLISAITRPNPLPPGHIKEIVIPNSPVTQPVMTALSSVSLPKGIRKQINDAQTSGTSPRAFAEQQLAALPDYDLAVSDLLRQYLEDTLLENPLDSVIAFLQTQNTLSAKQSLLEAYLANSSCSEARTLYNQINSTTDADYNSFSDLSISLCEQGRTFFELTTNEKQLLDNLAMQTNNTAVAAGAQNILRFVYNESFPEVIEDLVVPESLKIQGMLFDATACGGATVVNDTLLLIDSALQVVQGVTPAITDADGNFVFDFFELLRLDQNAQFTFAIKSGFPLQSTGLNTISEWIGQSPLTLIRTCPPATFQKTYGGSGDDGANHIQSANDGGFIMAGHTTSFGQGLKDFYVVKTDADGNVQWSKTYGTDSRYEQANSITSTQDGGYIIAGIRQGFAQPPGQPIFSIQGDILAVKTDVSGNMQWAGTYSGGFFDNEVQSLQLADGDYAMAGFTSQGQGQWDYLLLRTDISGNVRWAKTYGNFRNEFSSSLIPVLAPTPDGGFIIAGASNSYGAGGHDGYVVKTDPDGNLQWSKNYGSSNDDGFASMERTSDGGYILGGNTWGFSSPGLFDFWVVKTDQEGNVQWSKAYGSPYEERIWTVHQTSDGGYVLDGYTNNTASGSRDLYVIKTDAAGSIQWSKTYGGPQEEQQGLGNRIEQTSDGGYIMAGSTQSFGSGNGDVYLVKTDKDGNSGCNEQTVNTMERTVMPIVTVPPSIEANAAITIDLVFSLLIETNSGTLQTDACGQSLRQPSPDKDSEIQQTSILIAPNPYTGQTTISYLLSEKSIVKIEITNLLGQIVKTIANEETQDTGMHTYKFSAQENGHPAGLYLMRATMGGRQITGRLVEVR